MASLPFPQRVWFMRSQKKRRLNPVPLDQGVTFKPKEGN